MLIQKTKYTFTMQLQNKELTMIKKTTQNKIKALMKEAGGVRKVARESGRNYDTFWNVMRGLSPDKETVQEMVNKAKEIIAKKKEPIEI